MVATRSHQAAQAPALMTHGHSVSDEQLMQEWKREENLESFEVLYQRYNILLQRKAISIVQCPHAAEEIVSDVFVKLWNNRQSNCLPLNCRSYLFTAVRNQSIDYLRKISRQRQRSATLEGDFDSGYASPLEDVIGGEVQQAITSAIAALPPKGRHIFLLNREAGLTYNEIAIQLNLSIKTVETHMRRTLIFLRQRLHKEE